MKKIYNYFNRRSARQGIAKLITRLPFIVLLLALPWLVFAGKLISTNAYEVFGQDGLGLSPNDGIGDMGVGDTTDPGDTLLPVSSNVARRGITKFNLSGLTGVHLQSATLNLTILQSRLNDPGTAGGPCPTPTVFAGSAPLPKWQ